MVRLVPRRRPHVRRVLRRLRERPLLLSVSQPPLLPTPDQAVSKVRSRRRALWILCAFVFLYIFGTIVVFWKEDRSEQRRRALARPPLASMRSLCPLHLLACPLHLLACVLRVSDESPVSRLRLHR